MRRLILFALLLALANVSTASAADFNVACGDVAGLKTAINTANTNGEPDTINLGANCSYALSVPDNTPSYGPTGLPVITSEIILFGHGSTISHAGVAYRLLAVENGSLSVFNTTFTNGFSPQKGGAIHVSCGGSASVYDSTFSGNAALRGGAISVGGDGCAGNLPFLDVERSTFKSLNSADLDGGALWAIEGTMVIHTVTFNGNRAEGADPGTGFGGAVYGGPGTSVSVSNSTVAGNLSDTLNGGGSGAVHNAAVSNTVFSGNTDGNCSDVVDQDQNLSFPATDTSCPAGFSSGNPNLGVLRDNGGPTQTMLPGTGSAAIDVVPEGANCPSQEQRGVTRPVGSACDVGAVEVEPGVRRAACVVSSLINAINDANAAANADTIILPSNCTYTLTAADNSGADGSNGLPVVVTPISIQGNGATITRSSGAGFRFFQVSSVGDLSLDALTLSNGSNTGSGDGGGAIFALGPLSVTRSTFTGNSTDQRGGAIGVVGAQVVGVRTSTFSGNTAFVGGAVDLNGSGPTATLENLTLTGNSGTNIAGGISAVTGSATVTNSTLVGNEGGNLLSANDALTARNTVLTAPTTGTNCTSVADGGHNISFPASDTSCPAGFSSADPKFILVLADNGGPTKTISPGLDSPLLDAVPATGANCPSGDQRGLSRAQGSACDIGSVEIERAAPGCSPAALRAAMTAANAEPDFDVIDLPAGCVYTFTDAGPVAEVATPLVVRPLLISGHGATLRRDAAAPDMTLVFLEAGTLALEDLTFTGARSQFGPGAVGSGCTGSPLVIRRSTFFENTGGNGGAVAVCGPLTISDSLFRDNTAAQAGGAVQHNGDGAITVTNSTFTRNTASSGPGGAFATIATPQAVLTIRNSTIVQNTAATVGGGIREGASAPVTLENTIVASNSPDNCAGTITDGGRNVAFPASDTTCGASGFISGDPKLQPLGDYGGPTQSMRPLAGSSAVDVIATTGEDCPAADQRGKPRAAGPKCDVGAVESEQAPPACSDVSSSGAFGAVQALALTCSDPNGYPLTLSASGGPGNGSLGTIDQSAKSVSYTPTSGFSGADAFTFKAANGWGEATATARLTVGAAPVVIPPPKIAPGARGLAVGRRCILPLGRRGIRTLGVSFLLDQAATVTYSLERRTNSPGRRRCPAASGPQRQGGGQFRRLARYTRALASAARASASLRLLGTRVLIRRGLGTRLADVKLAPGTYRLTVTATNANGTSATLSRDFIILKA
jgi:Big-like domain-containing protein